jgi:hypothetical protein
MTEVNSISSSQVISAFVFVSFKRNILGYPIANGMREFCYHYLVRAFICNEKGYLKLRERLFVLEKAATN